MGISAADHTQRAEEFQEQDHVGAAVPLRGHGASSLFMSAEGKGTALTVSAAYVFQRGRTTLAWTSCRSWTWRPQTLCVMPLLCSPVFGEGRDFTAAPRCVWKPKREVLA